MEQLIKEANINYYDRTEFIDKEKIINGVYKANWKRGGKLITLKSFILDDDNIKEIAHEIKLCNDNDFNNVMMELYGITTDSGKHLLVAGYADGGTLRNHLKKNFPSLNQKEKYELAIQLSGAVEFLHERGIVHKDLHSSSILIHQNSIKLADSGLSKRIKDSSRTLLDTIPYTDPRGFDIEDMFSDTLEIYELNEKSDVYSIGVLLWELSSGKKPFSDKEYDSNLAEEIAEGVREVTAEGTSEDYYTLYEKCWDGDPDKRPTIQRVVTILKSMITSLDLESSPSKQKLIIQQFNLNHGLFLDGYSIEPSKQAVFIEDGELNIHLYEGQPLVYTSVNDRNSHINLLRLNSGDNDVELNESLRPSDICVNFPAAEITYTANLSESFSNFMDDNEVSLYEMYGHLFPRKITIGGKLFIDLKSATSTQIDMFKTFLTWIHDSAKYKKEIPFKSLLPAMNFFPKIITTDGVNLNTHEELIDWMNSLYQDDTVEIISYNNLVPISQLNPDTISLVDEIQSIQSGVANFKEKLTLENWTEDSSYITITRWIKKFQLLQGLIIDQNFKLRISKKNAIDLINIPDVNSDDKFYLKIVKPTTILEDILVNNNIYSDEDMGSFPFIKVSDGPSYEDCVHFLVKGKRYKILLNRDNIKPSEKFKQDIENALENMKPLLRLQEVFDEYGHLIPLNIVLGKSLKNTIENSSYISKRVDLVSPVFESLKSHLAKYSIPCLLTQKGDIIEKNGLSEWIQNTNNDLEIIEFDKTIPLYSILEVEQKKKIDIILNKNDNFKIIMTGSVDLKDSDITEQIIITIEPSLDNKNYEVFGSIFSKNNSKLEDIFVTFGSYEINKFSATIKTSKNKSINTKDCYILWMMIGNPSKLSVFSPNNREKQVDYIKESIKLQRDNSSYSIRTSHQLSQGYDISINYFKPINIKFTGWSKNCVYLNISNLGIDFNYTQPNVEVAVCTLRENSKINICGEKYTMGYNLTGNNRREEPRLEQTNTRKYINKRYPKKSDKEKENKLIIDNENLECHLDLSEFANLMKFTCSKNKLTSLDISKNSQLTEIDCSQNKLVSLDLSNCLNIKSVTANRNQLNELKLPVTNNEKLEYLNLLDNSFNQNLNCFSRLVNLKELLIGNTDEDRIQKDVYNQFHGSLKPLKKLDKLESLSINNTDIDFGLEFLPDSIKNFRCLADIRPEAKVKKIYEQLEIYTLSPIDAFQGRYNLKAWKKNWKLIKQKEAFQNQIKQVEEVTSGAKLRELENEVSSLNAREAELVEKNNHLEREIQNLEQEKNDLRQLVEELNAKLGQKNFVYQQIKQQLEERKEKLKSFTGEKLDFTAEQLMEKERLHKEVNGLMNELATKEKDVNQSEKELKETNMKLKAKDDESIRLKNELNDVRLSLSKIEKKREKLNTLKKKLEHEKHFTKAGTAGLRKQMDDLKRDLKSSRSKKAETEAKAKEIDSKLKEITKNKEFLLSEQISQQDFIKELQGDKKNLEEELETRRNVLNDKEDFINKLVQQNEEKINSLNNELKENEELINTLKQQNEEKTVFLNNEIKDKEELIDKLNKVTKNKEELIDKLNDETKKCQDSQKKITDLNNQLENKGDVIDKLQQQTDELKRQLNEEIRKYQISKENLTSLNNQLTDKEKTIEELRIKLDKETRKYQDSQGEITALSNQLENKDDVINKLQQQTDELKRQLNEETEKYQNSQKNFKKEISALLSQIPIHQTELSVLVNNVNKKHELGRKGRLLVDNILEKQINFIRTNDSSASEEIKKIRRKLVDYELTEEEIQNILYKQAEKTKLDMQLESLIS